MKEITEQTNPHAFEELVRINQRFNNAGEDVQIQRKYRNERIKRINKYKIEQAAAFKQR